MIRSLFLWPPTRPQGSTDLLHGFEYSPIRFMSTSHASRARRPCSETLILHPFPVASALYLHALHKPRDPISWRGGSLVVSFVRRPLCARPYPQYLHQDWSITNMKSLLLSFYLLAAVQSSPTRRDTVALWDACNFPSMGINGPLQCAPGSECICKDSSKLSLISLRDIMLTRVLSSVFAMSEAN